MDNNAIKNRTNQLLAGEFKLELNTPGKLHEWMSRTIAAQAA